MAIEKLLARIEEDARKEIDEIIKAAEGEAKRIIEGAREEGKKEAEKITKKGKKEAERARDRIISAAKREARMMITNAKEEVIQQCLEIIREKMASLPSKEYKKIVEDMVKDAIKEGGDYVLFYSRKEDKKIAEKLNIDVEGKIDAIGGVVLKAKDGSKEIDLTFDFLLERKKEEIRIMIAEKLFENVD
ncbi:MAG TPA: hypothetical protein ENJ70_02700 [Thermoplasmatales archaeon]|nr:hypothetical protein [Thermoplasmatales archaeon]